MKKILFCIVLLMSVLPLQAFAQAPEGACCYNDDTACTSPVTEDYCIRVFQGIWHANVSCKDNPCGPSIPTMNEWGMIIFAMLSGLGIIYFLRKQRKAEN